MRVVSTRAGLALLPVLAMSAAANVQAQPQPNPYDPIIVEASLPEDAMATATKGPEIKGVVTARNGQRIRVTSADGATTVINITDATRVRTSGLFGGGKLTHESVLNGLPVTVRTMQSEYGLLASQITFRKGDFKTANMIRNGTAQQFAQQTAATEALRGRMADLDQYNIKNTTNVYFATGRAALTPEAKADLCSAAQQAEGMDNALLLVVGYTDSVGSEEYNQMLSEKRAGSVINHLQQACRWKPWRVLTPTGMSESDPVASNDTWEGKAQNRRVSVNVLVSKAVDGL